MRCANAIYLSAAISRGAVTLAILLALLLIPAWPAQAQTEAVLYNFCMPPNCTDGGDPFSGFVADGAGNLYGVADMNLGSVFELSPTGGGGYAYSMLYQFGLDVVPKGPMIFDSAGNLYGATPDGGAYGWGDVFELSPSGGTWTFTEVYSFAYGSGNTPSSGVIMDKAGNLYGDLGSGAVYELSPDGQGGWTEQVIYTTCVRTGALTVDAVGDIFGIGCEDVFELSPNGNGGWTPVVLHTFVGGTKDGYFPFGAPASDSAGNIYGTTSEGGAKNLGTVWKLSPGKKGWQWKILHSFRGKPDGFSPEAGVVFDSAGNIYGTTEEGGKDYCGVVYELAAQPGKATYKENILWSFNNTDGCQPCDSLILDSAGNLYGTTVTGGSGLYGGSGVAFELTP